MGSSKQAHLDAQKKRMAQRVRLFLKAKGDQDAKGARVKWDKKFVPNVEHILGLDHALQGGTGLDLKHFQAARRPVAVPPGHRRYFVPADKLPICMTRDGFASRSCIANCTTGEKWLEVDWAPSSRKLLFEVLDCGSIGWYSKYFLFAEGCIRGCFQADPCHVRYNRFKTCVRTAGLWDIWLEGSILVGLRKGPWSGAAHFSTLREVAENMAAHGSSDDPLFQMLYEYILEDGHGSQVPEEAWSMEHIQATWDRLLEVDIFNKKGSKAKVSRWFSWPCQMRGMLKSLSWLLLVCLKVGIENNWYATVDDTPLVSSARVKPTEEVPDEAAAPQGHQLLARDDAAPDDADGAAAEPCVDQKRAMTKSTMHLACEILCNRAHCKVFSIICVLGEASETEHNKQVTKCKTQRGCLEWWSGLAGESWLQVCMGEVTCLCDPQSLSSMGFKSAHTPLTEEHPDRLEEQHLADSMMKLLIELLKVEINEGRVYSQCPPYVYGGLLHHDVQKRSTCMAFLKRVWVALEAAETHARDDPWMQAFLRNLVWTKQVWAREILIGLRECNFASLPQLLSKEIRACGMAMKSSKLAEDGFNNLRDHERLHKASKLGRASRWHATITSSLLEDAGRPGVVITDADKFGAGKKVPSSMFEAKQVASSLPDELLEQFRSAKTPWGPKPNDFHLQAQRLEVLLQAGSDYHKLKQSWLALLVEPGCILYKYGTNLVEHGLVLSVTDYGAVAWKVQGKRRGDFTYYALVPAQGAQPWRQLCVLGDLPSWEVSEVTLLPPAIVAARCDPEAAHRHGCLLVPTATKGLMAFAASRAFHRLNTGRLKELAAILEVKIPNTRPRTEFEWRRLLINSALPFESPEGIDCIIEEWTGLQPKEDVWGTCLTADGLTALEGALDQDEVAEIKAIVQTRCAQAAESHPGKASSSSAGAPKKRGRKPAKLKVPFGEIFTKDQARELLPTTADGATLKGCTIHDDRKLHMRWKASYPKKEAPFTNSCSWSEHISDKVACLRVLRWCWACHSQLTGQECPWDWGDLGD